MKFEYPLQWNLTIPRSKHRERSRFGSNRSAYSAGAKLENELRLLGATNVIISSNLKVKLDGGFYAQQQRVDDPGVCVYLKIKGKDKCLACDKWDKPEDNIWALALNVTAIRGMERWGGSNFMDGLFTGFAALPAPGSRTIYFGDCRTKEEIQSKFKELAKRLHPDVGGNAEEFQNMSTEYKQRMDNLERGEN